MQMQVKRGGNVFSSLMQNWDIAEATKREAENAQGSAEAELEKQQESLQGRLEALKANWESFSLSFMNTSAIKAGVSALSGIVGVIGGITTSLGGLGTAFLGLSAIGLKSSGVFTALSTAITGAFKGDTLKTGLAGVGSSLTKMWATTAGKLAIGGLGVAAVAAAGAYLYDKFWWQPLQQGIADRQETIMANEDIINREHMTDNLIAEFGTKNINQLTADQEQAVRQSFEASAKAIGWKAKAIVEATEANGDYLDGLRKIQTLQKTDTELMNTYRGAVEANSKLTAQQMVDKGVGKWGGNNYAVDLTGSFAKRKDADEGAALNYLKSEMKDYIKFTDELGHGFKLAPDLKTPEDITQYYYKLKKSQDFLAQSGKQATVAFREAQKALDVIEPQVKDFNEARFAKDVLNYESKYGDVDTREEYKAMLDTYRDGLATDEEKVQVEDFFKTLFPYLAKAQREYEAIQELNKNIWTPDEMKAVTDQFGKISAGKYDEALSSSLNSWYKGLDEQQQQLVTKIGQDYGYKTQQWSQARWEEELDFASRNETTLWQQRKSYRALWNGNPDENLSGLGKALEPQVKSMRELQGAYEKLGDTGLSLNEKFDLAMARPELHEALTSTNSLSEALEELAALDAADMLREIDEQIKVASKDPNGDVAVQSLVNFRRALVQIAEAPKMFNFDKEVGRIGAMFNAVNESMSPTGMTLETATKLGNTFKQLTGYDAEKMFNLTANGIQINNAELAKMQTRYENLQKSRIQDELINKQMEYNAAMAEYNAIADKYGSKAYETRVAGGRVDQVAEEINALRQVQSAWEGATSAYAKYVQNMQMPDVGDSFKLVSQNMEGVKKLFEAGEYGSNKLKEQMKLITGKDYNQLGTEKLIEDYKRFDEGIKDTGISLNSLFAEGAEGASNFGYLLDSLNENVVSLDTNTNRWSATMSTSQAQKLADDMGISMAMLEQLGAAIRQAGGEFEIVADTSSLGVALNEMERARAAVHELGGTTAEINLNFTSVEKGKTEIERIKGLIAEIESQEIKTDVDTANLEFLKAALKAAEEKVDQLNGKKATVEVEVKAGNIDKVRSDIESRFTSNPIVATTKVVLDQIEEGKKRIEANGGNTPKTPVPTTVNETKTLKIDVQGEDKVKSVEASMKAIYDRGVKLSVEVTNSDKVEQVKKDLLAIYDRGVKLDVVVSNENKVQQVKQDLLAIYDRGVKLDIIVSNDERISQVKQDLLAIYDRAVRLDVITENNESIAQVKEDLLAIYDRTVKLQIISEGTNEVTTVQEALLAIYDRVVLLTVISEGTEAVSTVQQALLALYDRDVFARVHAEGFEELTSLQSAINAIQGKTVNTSTTTSGYVELAMLQAAINMIYGRTVTVAAVGDTSGLAGVQEAINSISGRTVYVDVVYRSSGSPGGYSEGTVGRGLSFAGGTAYAGGTDSIGGRKLSSLGKAKKSGMALTGEQGFEILVV